MLRKLAMLILCFLIGAAAVYFADPKMTTTPTLMGSK